jgi:hypothetical protein
MAAISSGVNSVLPAAARFSSSCATLLAPISAEVTRWSRSTQLMAIWASDWPRARAISLSPEIRARFSSLSWSGARLPSRLARESAGTPARYFPVRRPCASGEKAMQPIPSAASVSSRPPSTQRLSSEYDGWWISSGVPSSRRIAAASAVRSAE